MIWSMPERFWASPCWSRRLSMCFGACATHADGPHNACACFSNSGLKTSHAPPEMRVTPSSPRSLNKLLAQLTFDPERMRRIDAEDLQFLAEECEFLQGAGERRLVGVRLDIGQELGRGEFSFDHIAFELGHIDAVGGETAERLVKRRRNVADPENKARHDYSTGGLRPLRDFRKHDEARRVVRFVLDIGREHVELMDFGGQPRRARRARRIGPFRDLPAPPRRVSGHMRGEGMRTDDLTALAEGMHMAIDRAHLREFCPLDSEQLKMDRQKIFRDDVEAGTRQK